MNLVKPLEKLTFKIGDYNFSNPLALAPMAGITDRVFRDLCRAQGAAYASGEMVASKQHLWKSLKSSTRHVDLLEQEPRTVQLLGTDPTTLAKAAVWQASQGAQIIDLNLGCPAKKVCKVAAGSALMSSPKLVKEIFQAVVSAVNIPVTVKMRTGLNSENRNALHIAQIAESCGLKAVTIHGRTREEKFTGTAEYDTVAEIKQKIDIVVIANGDIGSGKKVVSVLEYTGCDAVMIGRGSLGYPWIFREVLQYLSDRTVKPPTIKEFISVIKTHIMGLYTIYGDKVGLGYARKHVSWYIDKYICIPNKDKIFLRKSFNELQSTKQQLKFIEQINYVNYLA